MPDSRVSGAVIAGALLRRVSCSIVIRPKLTESAAAALEEFVRTVRVWVGSNLVALKLFGSTARGEATAESDLDVLVVVDQDRLRSRQTSTRSSTCI